LAIENKIRSAMTKSIDIPVREIMSRELVVVQPTDALSKVEQMFMAYNIHHLPVVNENGDLQGVISKYDLHQAPASGAASTVADIMTRQLATASPDTSLREVGEVFLGNILHAMPIVDKGELIGLVTAQDVLRYCLTENKLIKE